MKERVEWWKDRESACIRKPVSVACVGVKEAQIHVLTNENGEKERSHVGYVSRLAMIEEDLVDVFVSWPPACLPGLA